MPVSMELQHSAIVHLPRSVSCSCQRVFSLTWCCTRLCKDALPNSLIGICSVADKHTPTEKICMLLQYCHVEDMGHFRWGQHRHAIDISTVLETRLKGGKSPQLILRRMALEPTSPARARLKAHQFTGPPGTCTAEGNRAPLQKSWDALALPGAHSLHQGCATPHGWT